MFLFCSIQDDFVKLLVNPVCPAALWMKTPAGITYKKNHDEITELLSELLLYKKQQLKEGNIIKIQIFYKDTVIEPKK